MNDHNNLVLFEKARTKRWFGLFFCAFLAEGIFYNHNYLFCLSVSKQGASSSNAMAGRLIVEETPFICRLFQLSFRENPDYTILTVEAGLADHLTTPYAADSLAENRRQARNLLQLGIEKEIEFRSEPADRSTILAHHFFRVRPGP